MTMKTHTKLERRAIAAAWRALTSEDDERYRALDRLQALAGEVAAFDIWLRCKPNPALVEQVLRRRLLSFSPLLRMAPRSPVSWSLADTVGYRPRVEVL